MSQHTPGPWVATGNYVKTDDGVICTMARIGAIQFAAEIGSLEDSANARLIAASPGLYAAAKRLLNPVPGETLDMVMTALRDAVEQVEGRVTS